MTETVKAIRETVASLLENLEKAEAGNKSAAARARKDTLALDKLGKQYRKESVAAAK
jgi:hypothetical protein